MDASATGTRVRTATHEDLPAIVAAVADLLVELGSQPPQTAQMLESARALLEDPRAGALLLAEAREEDELEQDEGVVGVLTASYQVALHVPGRYALIQDLWVRPSWRGRAVGHELLSALFELARAQGMARAEVGLPRDTFADIDATEGFYVHNGFEHLGARMRLVFS
ncbi:MAG TPA: GNAT family N-acetyltransferase [Solirubrobacteraceae bacterium]|jgi:GNAT superfamily N-acetyltransferase